MTTATQSNRVLTFEQAYQAVVRYAAAIEPPDAEEVDLLNSLGRVLAQPALADRDFPPFPRSTRDGYALRSTDLGTRPAKLQVIGQIKAGGTFSGTVGPGQAVEIMTGAAVPLGADAVLMVEYTGRDNNQVEVRRAVAAGENIVPAGAEARAGQELLRRGVRVAPAQIAMAAGVGKARLKVYRRPRVAVLATGDELVEVAETPGPAQIRNSNSYSLAAQVTAVGGDPMRLSTAADEEGKLRELMRAGFAADMLLISGGVSMGKFDLVEQVLSKLGAEFFFTGALIQPGRPVVFGELRSSKNQNGSSTPGKPHDPAVLSDSQGLSGIPFFGLPGNPVSTMVTFDLFVRPIVQALCGEPPTRLPVACARLKKDFKTKTGLTRFLPAVLSGGLYDPEVETLPWQGSGDLLASARANCYLVAPPDRDLIPAGEMVSVLVR